ncbi:MAG: Ig-like domain-containing protein [Clostridia bacterium]|nr:Ig-like domain-containing protein [Clostridia bacterium]MDD4048326.1 Ig-like domain-containing protein [Clostridia bacterium]
MCIEAGKDGSAVTYTVTVLVEAEETSSLASYEAVTLTQTGDVANNDVQYSDADAVIAVLPTEIAVTLEDALVVNVPITWADTDIYSATTVGDYTFTASWGEMLAGANNDNNLTISSVEVTVA